MNKRWFVLSILLFLAVISIVILRNSRPLPTRGKTLRVGMMSGWAPFMTLNAQGNYEGFDVDVARSLAGELGLQLELVDLGSLPSLFVALEQGRIDCAMSGLDITRQRLQQVAMVPYFGNGLSSLTLLFWQIVPTDIRTINDMAKLGKPIIAVEPGSASEQFLKQYSFIEQKLLASVSEMVLDVQYGRSIAAILEPLVARRITKKQPEFKAVLVPLPEDFCIYGMGIALPKNQSVLTTRLQQAVAQLQKRGVIVRFAQQWGLDAGDARV